MANDADPDTSSVGAATPTTTTATPTNTINSLAGSLSLVAAVFQIASPNQGVGWTYGIGAIAILVLAVTGRLLIRNRDGRNGQLSVWQRRWAWATAAVALVALLISISSAAGVRLSVAEGSKDKPEPPSTSQASSGGETTVGNHTDTVAAAHPVTLTEDATHSSSHIIGLKVMVNRAPKEGYSYWLVLRLFRTSTQNEYYARHRLNAEAGRTQTIEVELPDIVNRRTVQVFEVDKDVAAQFQIQLESPFNDTAPLAAVPCGDCEASKAVKITP